MSTAAAKPDAALVSWVKSQLQSFLGYPDDGQLTQHVLSFTRREELQEWAGEMLGTEPKIGAFVAELWRKKGGGESGGGAGGGRQSAQQQQQEEKGPARRAPPASDADLFGSRDASTSSAALKQKHAAPVSAPTSSSSAASSSSGAGYSLSSSGSGGGGVGSIEVGRGVKVKYVASKFASRPVARVLCHCQATSHELFTNCTACGKIICAAEGEGPCFFCGSMVTQQGSFIGEQFRAHMRGLAEAENTPEQLAAADAKQAAMDAAASAPAAAPASSSTTTTTGAAAEEKKSADAAATAAAAAASDASSLAAAEAQRNKLLAFSRTDGHKAMVYDDQSDWFEFESNSWLSKDAKAKKKAETEQALLNLDKRKEHTLTIDLAGKSIVTHSSDAFIDTMQSSAQKAPKWTDTDPNAGSSSASASSASHGSLFSAASQRGGAGAGSGMHPVSRVQYFHNDTLTGRAKEVYQALKDSLKPLVGHSANPNDRPDISSRRAGQPMSILENSNALLASLAKAQERGGGNKVQLSLDADEDGGDAQALDGVTDRMSELEIEERLAANRAKHSQRPSCGGAGANAANDEDEPTNCSAEAHPNDSAFDDASDKGVCLSMWQPWASLLVLGIKRFEGRGWYTPHRGRVWIASGAREVDPAEVAAVEAEYRAVYGPDAKIPFPKDYPTSALLGCVDLNNCWSLEEFQSYRAAQALPIEDSASSFVFVCSNPRILPLAQAISGQHKLWNLPPRLFTGLQPTLKPVPDRWRTGLSASAAAAAVGGFDLWPATLRPASAAAAASSSSSGFVATRPAISSLQPGMLLLKQALPLAAQQALVDCVRALGLVSGGAGFAPLPGQVAGAAAGKEQDSLKRFSVGLAWHAESKSWRAQTATGTNKALPKVPQLLLDTVARCFELSTEFLVSHGAGNRNSGAMLPPFVPDHAQVTYFPPSAARSAIHQDRDESSSPETIKAGYPVVCISIGDTAEFSYGDKRIPEDRLGRGGAGAGAASADNKYNKLMLTSGDVLLFGGPSRLIFHGVDRIVPNSKPRDLFVKDGRVEIVFRKR